MNRGYQNTPIAPFTALVLGNEVYRRELELFFQFAGDINVFLNSPDGIADAHWVDELIHDGISLAENLKELLALPPSAQSLPNEDTAPDYAWADNVGRSVTAKYVVPSSIRLCSCIDHLSRCM